MQNHFLTSIRSMKLIDGCKSTQVYAVNPPSTVATAATAAEKLLSLRPTFSFRSKSVSQQSNPTNNQHQNHHTPSLDSLLSTFGLPSPDLIHPSIDHFFRPIEQVDALASAFVSLSSAISSSPSSSHPSNSLCYIHLEHSALLRGIDDPKLFRRALRSARIHSQDIHHKVVLSAWLRYERREDEFGPFPALLSCSPTSPALECPRAALSGGYAPDVPFDPCPCRCTADPCASSSASAQPPDLDEEDIDLRFSIGEEEIPCVRCSIASLSRPLATLLYGGFAETCCERINFTDNGISARAMRAVEAFSRGGSLNDYPPDTVLEVLGFANRFCCEHLKATCDSKLASLVRNLDDALLFIDDALEETAYLLVAACLQVFLRELPRSLQKPEINLILCSHEGKERLAMAGHASFALYHFLSQVAMEEDLRSNTTVMLLERMGDCASHGWQKQLAMHQLGCVMLERGEYKDAQKYFEIAVKEGHAYSVVGLARAKYKKGHKYSAYKLLNSMISEHPSCGWMHQERSLYCNGNEKMIDLSTATKLDPTLSYPYKYRAVTLAEEDKLDAAVAEISKILGFKVSTDCLELRAWFYLALGSYELALQDIRAILTLDPGYMMFHGKMHGDQLIDTLRQYVQPWDMADCWMQLYDRWSAVDDIGSLAVVHQMLTKESGNSSLRFRQSLLLLRLNCQKAAMHSLRIARNHSTSEHERLIYEGWILYDTGHRKEGLAKAEESISLQRSFEAFFLKAYALADTSLDKKSSAQVIQLLELANNCASDNLRKGQAHNNMGSVYVDCDMLDEAAECYMKALGIKHTRAHQGLARVFYLKNQKKAAYDEMTKLIEKAKNNASAYEKRSEYCDRDMARSDLNRASKLDPLRTYPYRYRAAVLMDDHKENEAISELSRALSFKPDLHLVHLRAAFYDSIGNTAAALRDCEAALCIEPDHADTRELYCKARARATEQQ